METVNNDIITKEIDKYITNKTNFNKLFVEGKIDPKLTKYLPRNPQYIYILKKHAS